jgi:hypothetical protein
MRKSKKYTEIRILKENLKSYSNSYIGTILWKQRFYVKHLIKYFPNQKSLYKLVIEKLELVLSKRM